MKYGLTLLWVMLGSLLLPGLAAAQDSESNRSSSCSGSTWNITTASGDSTLNGSYDATGACSLGAGESLVASLPRDFDLDTYAASTVRCCFITTETVLSDSADSISGWLESSSGDDCDDDLVAVNPVASEVTCDGIDNDCDSGTEDAPDVDGDGYDICDSTDTANPDGLALDCLDDTSGDDAGWNCGTISADPRCAGQINPGASETTCDGADNDCSSSTEDAPDTDLDMFDICSSADISNPDGNAVADCNDSASAINPGAGETTCDNVDNDCDAGTEDAPDADLDTYDVCSSGDTVNPDGNAVADCDDGVPAINPGVSETTCDGIDNDCSSGTADAPNTDGDAYDVCDASDPGDTDGFAADCDDGASAVNPGAAETSCDGVDNDCDSATVDGPDTDGDGFDICSSSDLADPDGNTTADCDDDDTDDVPGCPSSDTCAADIFPGATDIAYDGVDQDCDGTDLEDVDGDGFASTVVGGSDCDDDPSDDPAICATDPTNSRCANQINTAAGEVCDGLDNNCNGLDDADNPGVDGEETDNDGDFYVECDTWSGDAAITGGGDCDDTLGTVSPVGVETAYDGIDQDCSGADLTDVDGDGFSADMATGGTPDCDDTEILVFPGAAETCNGTDDDCDGSIDEGLSTDADGDGFNSDASCESPADCDDTDPNTFDGATELCDGIDNSCDGALLASETDDDVDGYVECTWIGSDVAITGGDDCDDDATDNAAGCAALGTCANQINPGGSEVAYDGVDQDCSGADLTDVDGDGFDADMSVGGTPDCDDTNTAVNPGAPEICDGIDNDCDGALETGDTDADGDGVSICDGDCDDTDATIFPGTAEICDGADTDCDGSLPVDEQDADADGFGTCEGDCNDASASVSPGLTAEVCDGIDDTDCNAATTLDESDSDGDGVKVCASDCDDTSALVFPGASEICDGLDNDCNGIIPSTEVDNDGDGEAVCDGDCDDVDATTFSAASEICDGVDNNCDSTLPTDERDTDGDFALLCDPIEPTASSALEGGDCDDADATRFPSNPEICDGVDNNCDGVVPTDETDSNGDGTIDCAEGDTDGDGLTASEGDCDDTNSAIYTGAPELCDGLDNDCDGAIPTDETDGDGDGESTCEGDCDDADGTRFTTNSESCDGVDNDCNGIVPSNEADNDGDGQIICAGDCDDFDATTFDGASEICDGVDNNCDSTLPTDERDEDGDNALLCDPIEATADAGLEGGDCDDGDATRFPSNPESCDGVDNDCDGVVPTDETDSNGDGVIDCAESDTDGDGLTASAGDCDDADATVYTGAPELCDGLDNDCDGAVPTDEQDVDFDGQSTCEGDCDDADPLNFEGNTELCDGQDNDCNGLDDAGLTGVSGQETDTDVDGEWPCEGDCDDTDPANFSTNAEICDGQDNDCNGLDDAGSPGSSNQEIDADDDCFVPCSGWSGSATCISTGGVLFGDDCDDTDNSVYPAAADLCDGQYNDCDLVDAVTLPLASFLTLIPADEEDNDGDGWVECQRTVGDAWNPAVSTTSEPLNSYDTADLTTVVADCDDTQATVYPDATELCDGRWNDCPTAGEGSYDSTAVPADEVDDDIDGWVECVRSVVTWNSPTPDTVADPSNPLGTGWDCDDTDAAIYPAATENCDGLANDCDGVSGYVATDDTSTPVFTAPADESDDDADGYVDCTGWSGSTGGILGGDDCDDADDQVWTGAAAVCDGQYNDCDRTDYATYVPVDESDDDGDGWVECTRISTITWRPPDATTNPEPLNPTGVEGDCDDTDALTYPRALETGFSELDNELCYRDADGDTWGDDAVAADSGITAGSDCDDSNASVQPGAGEVCETDSQIDDDCDGSFNTATDPETGVESPATGDTVVLYEDLDTDGFGGDAVLSGCVAESGFAITPTDCDDLNAEINPAATELCNDLDDDCDGSIDEPDDTGSLDATVSGCVDVFLDADNDGVGTFNTNRCLCLANDLTSLYRGQNYVLVGGDCDDTDSATYPLTSDVSCSDGLDNDNDGDIDGQDTNGDGVVDDCLPGYDEFGSLMLGGEVCFDGVDNDLDGRTDECEPGLDEAGTSLLSPRQCADGIDNDGDGAIDECTVDADEWGRPFRGEFLDGSDNNCDDFIPVVELDCDDDGSLPVGTGDATDTIYFESAADLGLSACDTAASLSIACWDEAALSLVCDSDGEATATSTATQLLMLSLTESQDGFGGRFSDGRRDYITTRSCSTRGDCDDQCTSRCPDLAETCDGIDNDCSEAVGSTDIAGLPAALDSAVLVAGTVPPEEIDLDGDGFLNCDDPRALATQVQWSSSTCGDEITDTALLTDCNSLCSWVNPSATELCNGFLDLCDSTVAEGTDADRDEHRSCGAWSGDGEELAETFPVVVWRLDPTIDPTTTTLPSIVPLLVPRSRTRTDELGNQSTELIACDDALTTALTEVLEYDASTLVGLGVDEARSALLEVCFPADTTVAAASGACGVLELTLGSALDETIETLATDAARDACITNPEQSITRTMWSQERLLEARQLTVAHECRRMFGVDCAFVEDSSSLADTWSVMVDAEAEALADTTFALELARYSPVAVTTGTVGWCWGDPTRSLYDITLETGGDCDDGTTGAHRDEPEGPWDLVDSYRFPDDPQTCALCLDGIDNNCDGKIDCEDPSCAPCFVGQGSGCAATGSPCAQASCAATTAGADGTAERQNPALLLIALGLSAGLSRRRKRSAQTTRGEAG